MTEERQVRWMGRVPVQCDVTGQPIKGVFVDGRLRSGVWACMTPEAHERWGTGLGLGKGQRYERQGDGSWLKVAG